MLGGDPTIKSIGFALAFGVLVDAFVVRMTIVPAVMTLLGERAWYLPGWLDRILPDVDLEGSRLREHTPHGWERPSTTQPADV
jgi:RND superfamily putative drug exporter